MTSIYMGVPGDENKCREVFEFARKLKVKTIVSEPDPEDLDTIEKFCDEYGINLALHNHPKGKSEYWHPREVLKACEGRSKRIGACADIGHWQRSGIKPVDGVRMLGERIISFHIKDLNRFGTKKAHDVPWGTGQGGLQETFKEIDRLGIEPTIFGIEYEHNWKNSMPEIAECVKFFKKTASLFKATPVSRSFSAELTLANDGQTTYQIVVADNASPSTKHGAEELQTFLEQITGARLPIVSERQPQKATEIILGNNAHFKNLGIKIDFDALGDEGYVIRTVGDTLVIAGGELRGNMYGVYGFLEDHLGCRWFTPEVSRIPKKSQADDWLY